MVKPLARVALLFGVTLPLVACGLFLDLEPIEFTDVADGAGSDAPTSGDAADAGANDATTITDGGPSPDLHCSDGKPHDFCDDFEAITGEVQDRWQKRRELQGTGTLGALALPDASPPNTVLDTSIARDEDAGVVPIARLSRQESPWPRAAGGAQPGVRIRLDVLFDRLDEATHPAAIVGVVLGATSFGEDFISIYAWQDAKKVHFKLQEEYRAEDGGPRYAGKELVAISDIGVWVPIELEIGERPAGLGGGATVRIGAATESYGLASTSRTSYFRSDVGVSVGTFAGANAHVLLDNVRMDYLP